MASVQITTAQGIVRGISETTENNFDFYSFVGIPYAQPPIGKLRFKDPLPVESWTGIRDATKEGNVCYHTDLVFNVTAGAEDCLYLNVFTPKIPTPEQNPKLPVMVSFHGGGFKNGSGRRKVYGPEFLVDKNVILVTMNFRLGALGFLMLRDASLGVYGNASLKDQVMCLKWIQQNIAKFGGDPNNVTIFGESSGAACVGYLMLSPMAKGLFHKAILQSGVATCPWARGTLAATYELVRLLGKEARNDAEVLKILQDASVEELNEAQNKFKGVLQVNSPTSFGPLIEKHNQEDHLFLPDTPINILKSGNYNKVPIIIGINSGEGLAVKVIEQTFNVNLQPETEAGFIPYTLGIDTSSTKAAELGALIKQFYYGDQEREYSPKSIWYDLCGDTHYSRPCLQVVEHLMQNSSEKIYLYQFCLKTKLNMFSAILNIKGRGCCHVDDLYYLFKAELTKNVPIAGAEEMGIMRMTKWWTNFAKYTDPNGVSNDPVLTEKWINANPEEMQYMEIDKNIKLKLNYLKKVNDFWKSIEKLV